MPMKKLDLFGDKTVDISVHQLRSPDEEVSEPESGEDEQPIVISFDVGDPEKAANWSRVRLLPTQVICEDVHF